MATRAARYPDAMDGFIEFVGVSVVEQLRDDWPRTGSKKKQPSKAAKTGDIPNESKYVKSSPSNVQQQSEER